MSAPVDVLAVMDTIDVCLHQLQMDPNTKAMHIARFTAARHAVADLIRAANRASIASYRGDESRPGTIRNADLDALRAAAVRAQGGAA